MDTDGGWRRAGMRFPWMGPREQACMLAEKERSSLEPDLPSVIRENGPGSRKILSVEGPMSAERARLCHTPSISNGRTKDFYTTDVKNALK